MRIENLTVKFNDKTVLNNLSLTVNGGEITCVLGSSGVGKTTLLKSVAGLISYEGEIERETTSYVFQEPRLIEGVSVYKNLKLISDSEEDILRVLKTVRLEDKKYSYPKTLSGGEKQRVNLARAFLYPSKVALLDEPFSSLDVKLKIELLNDFINLWKREKKPVLFVTHDIEEALMVAGRIIVLKDGKISLDIKIQGDYPREYSTDNEKRKLLLSAL